MPISWDKHYPDQKILKKEINFMLEAFVEVLFEKIPKSEVGGIYFKGSAQKKWESPLDYVPELSDIDIHFLFTNDSSIKKYLGTSDQAVYIQSMVEARYFSKIVKPYHVPRPQFLVLNGVLGEDDFISSPKSAITVLYGMDYPESNYKNLKRIKEIDSKHLIDEEQYVSRFPLHIVDKPSKYLWQSLRSMVWRVSPIGSRILSIMGIPYEKAWGLNRTGIVSLLKEKGEHQLVQDYSQFYLSGWEYFLSDYNNTDAGRKSVISGINALSKAIQIAKLYSSSVK